MTQMLGIKYTLILCIYSVYNVKTIWSFLSYFLFHRIRSIMDLSEIYIATTYGVDVNIDIVAYEYYNDDFTGTYNVSDKS